MFGTVAVQRIVNLEVAIEEERHTSMLVQLQRSYSKEWATCSCLLLHSPCSIIKVLTKECRKDFDGDVWQEKKAENQESFKEVVL